MRNLDLIKNLRKFQQISPNNDWALSARANLINHINQQPAISNQQSAISILLMPLPRFAFSTFSGVLALFVVIFGSITLSMNSGVVFENLDVLMGQIAVNKNTGNSVVENNQKSAISTEESVKNTNNTALSQNDDNEILASIRLYDKDDIGLAVKTALRERINRLSVLAYEAKDYYLMELVNEADKLYQEGDYDGALRVVTAAESLL